MDFSSGSYCRKAIISIIFIIIFSLTMGYPSVNLAAGNSMLTPTDTKSLWLTGPENNYWTNKNQITIVGVALVSPAVRINDSLVATDIQGGFSQIVRLNPGKNLIVVSATDGQGNKFTETRNVFYDNVPPEVTLTAPAHKTVTGNDFIIVTGFAEPGSLVRVNGELTSLDASGYFSQTVDLGLYSNLISVIASDTAGNNSVVERMVYFTANRVAELSLPAKIIIGSGNIIKYRLITDASVSMNVYSLDGTHVRTLLNNEKILLGPQSLKWNGKNQAGNLVSDGKYRIVVEARNRSGKLIGRMDKFGLAVQPPKLSGPASAPIVFNPLKGEQAALGFKLSGSGLITVKVFKNKLMVKTLASNLFRSGGNLSVAWNGRDARGKIVDDDRYTYLVEVVSKTDKAMKALYRGTVIVEKSLPVVKNLELAPVPYTIGRASLRIKFQLSESSKVYLKVKNKTGSPVAVLLDGVPRRVGPNMATWDGKDKTSKYVPPGVYTVAMAAYDDYGKWSKSITKTLLVNPAPVKKPRPVKKVYNTTTAFVRLSGSAPENRTTVMTVKKESPVVTDLQLSTDLMKIGASSLNARFAVSERAKIIVKFTNDSGATVRTMAEDHYRSAGNNNINWDGKDDSGNYIPEGNYTLTLQAADPSGNTSGSLERKFIAAFAPKISTVITPGILNPLLPSPNNKATISYIVYHKATISIEILKNNAPIRMLVSNQTMESGIRSFEWDGKDEKGQVVGDGEYTVRIKGFNPWITNLRQNYNQLLTVEKAPPYLNELTVNPKEFKAYKTPVMSIRYKLSEDCKVDVEIYAGNQLVRSIFRGRMSKAGNNSATWNGLDDQGSFTHSGSYIVVITAVDKFDKKYVDEIPFTFVPKFVVLSSSPKAKAVDVPLQEKLVLNFNETLKKGPDFANITLSVNNREIPIRVQINKDQMIINTIAPMANNTNYQLNIPEKAVLTTFGAKLADGFVLDFTTLNPFKSNEPSVTVNLAGAMVSSFTTADNKTVTSISINETAALAIMKKYPRISLAIIPVSVNSDIIDVKLTDATIREFVYRNTWLEVSTPKAIVRFPALDLNQGNLRRYVDTELADAGILNIRISSAGAEAVALAQKLARQNNFKTLLPTVEISFKYILPEQEYDIPGFNKYLSVTLMPQQLPKNSLIGGMVLNKSGGWLTAPTAVRTVNKKISGLIRSQHLGFFVLFDGQRNFKDLTKHQARTDINLMAAKLLISADKAGNYGPNALLSRSELASLLVKALGLMPQKPGKFTDVNPKAWYVWSVGAAVDSGLLSGYSNGLFKPTGYLTRQEAAVVLVRAMKLAGFNPSVSPQETQKLLGKFKDSGKIAPWVRTQVAVAVQKGLVSGNAKGMLNPQQPVTRAEFLVMLKKMLTQLGFI